MMSPVIIPPAKETPTDTKNPRNCINAMSLPLELIENSFYSVIKSTYKSEVW